MAEKEMRAVLAEELEKLMRENENIVVIDSDLAKANGTIALRKVFPDRAFDVGIAEQNMASVAAGMASYGYVPFIGTFTPFASRRICDQVAISICYAKQNVKIIGSDPGVTAELNGGTHMSVEDVAVLRSLPGMVVFEPADNVQLKQALPQIVNYDGPVYIRMFRKKCPDLFDEATYQFDLFKADVLQEGTDVTLITSGGVMARETLEAAEQLKAQGISAEVVLVNTIKPLDAETILASAKKTGAVVTAENHSIVGGLGGAVAELLAENLLVPMKRIGIRDHFGEVGFTQPLLEKYGMKSHHIAAAAAEVIAKK